MSAEQHDMPRGTAGIHEFAVIGNEEVAPGICRLEISSHVSWGLQPGQFMNFEVPGDKTHVLRIPLSFSHADLTNSHVVSYYAVVGEGTERLSKMAPGDLSTVVGPCGKGWRLPQAGCRRALLVAGGIGFPPVAAAAGMLSRAGIGFDVAIGVKSVAGLVHRQLEELEQFEDKDTKIVVATDDGSFGIHGFASQAAEQLLAMRNYDCVYTCGPQIMMASIAKLASEHGIACQASMERMMGCGFGACGACNVPLKAGGYASCCMDGPVFDAEEVAW